MMLREAILGMAFAKLGRGCVAGTNWLVIASASEAIQFGARELDCFVATLLAMTVSVIRPRGVKRSGGGFMSSLRAPAKQSSWAAPRLDCFVATLLAMTIAAPGAVPMRRLFSCP